MIVVEMTGGELLAEMLPRWRASMATHYPSTLIDSFVRRNRGVLEVFATRGLARLRARRGELPDTALEFAAYEPIVARERGLDAQSDAAVLDRLCEHIDGRIARGDEPERTVLAMLGDDYVNARTEAILLRQGGWDAVPLLLRKPALAVVLEGAVVAVRDTKGRLATHPLKPGELNHLRFDVDRAEIHTADLRDAVDIEDRTTDGLLRFARAVWSLARKPPPPGIATPRPRTT
jgi:hypothetical protein